MNKRESIWRLCQTIKHGYLCAREQDKRRGHRSSGQEVLKDQYRSTAKELGKFETGYYQECTQQMKLGSVNLNEAL
jgi:hypothetical protein